MAPPDGSAAMPIGHNGGPELEYDRNLVDTLCAELVDLQRMRAHLIVTQSRQNHATEALLARALRSDGEQDPEERKRVHKRAKTVRLLFEKGGEPNSADALALVQFRALVELQGAARKPADDFRNNVELEMRRKARALPCWPYAKSIRGVSDLSVAVMVGCAGNLGGYATKERLWKRLGLAVIDGERQAKRVDPVLNLRHGYSPKRRAEMWVFFGEVVLRAQWAAARDEDGEAVSKSHKPAAVPAHAIGPYGELYARRRALTAERAWSAKRKLDDGKRIMAKGLIADLWRAWHGKPPRFGRTSTDGVAEI